MHDFLGDSPEFWGFGFEYELMDSCTSVSECVSLDEICWEGVLGAEQVLSDESRRVCRRLHQILGNDCSKLVRLCELFEPIFKNVQEERRRACSDVSRFLKDNCRSLRGKHRGFDKSLPGFTSALLREIGMHVYTDFRRNSIIYLLILEVVDERLAEKVRHFKKTEKRSPTNATVRSMSYGGLIEFLADVLRNYERCGEMFAVQRIIDH